MSEIINETTSVIAVFNKDSRLVLPWKIKWSGRTYTITTVDFHHAYRKHTTLFHIFSVSDGNLFFRLSLNTDSLGWMLEEVSDA